MIRAPTKFINNQQFKKIINNQQFKKNYQQMENTKANLNNILTDLIQEAQEQFNEEEKFAIEELNENAMKKSKLMSNIWLFVVKKLLGKLKIKITIYWGEKTILEYIIPKD